MRWFVWYGGSNDCITLYFLLDHLYGMGVKDVK